MKNKLFALLLLISAITYGQTEKRYYCIQIMSTENPHLIKPEMVVTDSTDIPMVDIVVVNSKMRSRILYVYEDVQQQIINFFILKELFPDAVMYSINEKQAKGLVKLFDNISNL